MAIPIELFILGGAFLITIIGMANRRFNILKILGSMMLIVTSVATLINGISGVSNFLTEAIAGVSFGIGIIGLVVNNFSDDRSSSDESYEEDDGRYHDND